MARRRLSRTITRARSMSTNRPSNNRGAIPIQATDRNNNAPSVQTLSSNRRSLSVPLADSSAVRAHQETLFTNPNLTDAPVIEMYTDGSCYPNSESGIGVFFGESHELNLSQALPPPHDSGLAEISAARIGLTALRNWPGYNAENVTLKTDYLGIIRALQTPNLLSGRFSNEYRQLHSLAQSFPRGVLFEHVNGHTGISGNEAADDLATNSTARGRSRSQSGSRSRSRSRTRNGSSATVETRPRSVYIPALQQTATEPSVIISGERISRSRVARQTANSLSVMFNSVDQLLPTNGPSNQEEPDANHANDEGESDGESEEELNPEPAKKI